LRGFRPCIPSAHREELGACCDEFGKNGYRAADPRNLRARLDRDVANDFLERIVDTHGNEGRVDSRSRIGIPGGIGTVARLIFLGNERPFHMAPSLRIRRGQIGVLPRTPQQTKIAHRTYNRWLQGRGAWRVLVRAAGAQPAVRPDMERPVAASLPAARRQRRDQPRIWRGGVLDATQTA
jgi:hypothetical protein